MAKEESEEKRGPVEKGPKGWPVNPLGVIALLFFGFIIIFFVVKPFFNQKTSENIQLPGNSTGGQITTPTAGQIVKSSTLILELSVNDIQKTQKVQFWAKSYADGKWEMIGEVSESPFKLQWQIPAQFQNKAIAITSHIYQKDGQVIKDPGGWREGIILLSQ